MQYGGQPITGTRRKRKQTYKSRAFTEVSEIPNSATKKTKGSTFTAFNKRIFFSLNGNQVFKTFCAYIIAQQDAVLTKVKPYQQVCRAISMETILQWN